MANKKLSQKSYKILETEGDHTVASKDTTGCFMRAESEGNYGMRVILSTKWGIDHSYLCQ